MMSRDNCLIYNTETIAIFAILGVSAIVCWCLAYIYRKQAVKYKTKLEHIISVCHLSDDDNSQAIIPTSARDKATAKSKSSGVGNVRKINGKVK